jgi:uncharacterized membrane protein
MALLGGIFGIAAWVRASRLLHRVARLEETSGELLATVRRLRQPAEAPPPYAASLSPPLPLDAEAEPIPTLRKPVPQPAVTPPAATQPPTAPPLIPPQAPPERDDAIPGSQPRPHSPFLAVRWEQWIGVRGAAIVGGSVLALAALLFFRYSIERGLISPTLRVILGVTAGVACIFGSEWLRKRQQTAAANALAGAGVVALYASIWAARILYDLITTAPAFVMMVVVTAACGVLADRRQSLLIAVLGLLGGFATPLLVAARQDEPFSLFAYVLLLDAGLLWIAVRRRWPLLALLSLAGTTLHQGIWILGSMERARSGIGIAVLAVFVVAFLIAARLAGADSLTWRLSRAGAVLLPFAFALYFAARAQLSAHLAPIGALLLLLVLSASRLANVRNERALPFASAGASLGIITVWWFQHDPGWAETWEAVAVCITIAAAFLLGSELRLLGGRPQAPSSSAAFIAELGMLAILIIAAVAADDPRLWPWLSAWIVLGGLLVRHAFTHGPAAGVVVAELGGAVGLALFCLAHADDPGAEPVSLLLGVALALALVMQALAILSRATALARLTEHGAAAGALTLPCSWWPARRCSGCSRSRPPPGSDPAPGTPPARSRPRCSTACGPHSPGTSRRRPMSTNRCFFSKPAHASPLQPGRSRPGAPLPIGPERGAAPPWPGPRGSCLFMRSSLMRLGMRPSGCCRWRSVRSAWSSLLRVAATSQPARLAAAPRCGCSQLPWAV